MGIVRIPRASLPWAQVRQLNAQATRSSSARTAKTQYWRARMLVRPATLEDRDALWRIIEPVLRAGETYALPRDWGKAEALEHWMAPAHEVFVAELDGAVVGTYFIQANQRGGGAHVAN